MGCDCMLPHLEARNCGERLSVLNQPNIFWAESDLVNLDGAEFRLNQVLNHLMTAKL